MNDRRGVLPSLVAAAMCAGIVGCGAPSTSSTSTTDVTPVTQSRQVPSPSSAPTGGNDGTVVDVDIAGGVVSPTNGQAQAAVGRPIVLMVNSDIQDQLHVHSVPEYTFDVQAGPAQSFEFTVDVPGRVDVELHDLGRSVATIEVRP